MTTRKQDNQDPDDAAMQADARPRLIFGQVEKKAYYAALVKGIGKVVFDSEQHRPEQRVTAIELTVYPMPGSRLDRPIARGMIAESDEWTKTVLPSLKALNIDLRSLDGRYVKAELVPIGTYQNKAGEEKTRTTIRFLEIYSDDRTCQRAQDAYLGVVDDDSAQPAVTTPQAHPATLPSDKERDIAKRFLPALWNGTGGDVSLFRAAIAGNPLTSKYFNLNSPEVIEIIQTITVYP